MDIKTSSGQKKGGSGLIMASFDSHIKCVYCHDKRSGNEPCIQKRRLSCMYASFT